MVTAGDLVSSIKYRVFKEGRAMKINMNAGKIVQMVSISCPSMINLLNFFLSMREITRYTVRIVIRVRMIIAWSWKNRMCSMEGDLLS